MLKIVVLFSGALQADRTERADAQKRVDTAVANLVKHWSAAMPKGNLTAGALKHLLEQRDNKLFDGITALCVNPHVAPIFPPGVLLLPTHTHIVVLDTLIVWTTCLHSLPVEHSLCASTPDPCTDM